MNLTARVQDVVGADMLYNSLVTHYVLNSSADFNGFGGPFRLDAPLVPCGMEEDAFVDRWREIHARPPLRASEEASRPAEASRVTKLCLSRAMGTSFKDIVCHCRPSDTADHGSMTRDMPAFVRQLGEAEGISGARRLRELLRDIEDAARAGGAFGAGSTPPHCAGEALGQRDSCLCADRKEGAPARTAAACHLRRCTLC